MKKILFSLTLLLGTLFFFAQVPEKMSYQAVMRNASGQLLQNQNIAVKASILQGSATGTVVYSERLTATTNVNGLVSTTIGSGSVLSGSFSTINWSSGNYYLKTETDPTGGSNYTIEGTSQLLSVPYAMYAKTSGNVIPQEYVSYANFTTNTQGTLVDLASTNMTVPVSGVYLITYLLKGYNNSISSGTFPVQNIVTNTVAYLYNKTSNTQYQNQAFDVMDHYMYYNGAQTNENYSLHSHPISGSLVKSLNAGDVIGFKVQSSVVGTISNPANIFGNTEITIVRLR